MGRRAPSKSSRPAPGRPVSELSDRLEAQLVIAFLPRQDRADDVHLGNQAHGPAFTSRLALMHDNWKQRTSKCQSWRGPEPLQSQLDSTWFQLFHSAGDKTRFPEVSGLAQGYRDSSQQSRGQKIHFP